MFFRRHVVRPHFLLPWLLLLFCFVPLGAAYPRRRCTIKNGAKFRVYTTEGFLSILEDADKNNHPTQLQRRGYLLEGEIVESIMCSAIAEGSRMKTWVAVTCPKPVPVSVPTVARCNTSMLQPTYPNEDSDAIVEAAGWASLSFNGFRYLRPLSEDLLPNKDVHEGILSLEIWNCVVTRWVEPPCMESHLLQAKGSMWARLQQARDVIALSLKIHYSFSSVEMVANVSEGWGETRRLTGDEQDPSNYLDAVQYEVRFTAVGGQVEFDLKRARLHHVLQRYLDDAAYALGVFIADTHFATSKGGRRRKTSTTSTSLPTQDESWFEVPEKDSPSWLPFVIVLASGAGVLLIIFCILFCLCLKHRRRIRGKDPPIEGLVEHSEGTDGADYAGGGVPASNYGAPVETPPQFAQPAVEVVVDPAPVVAAKENSREEVAAKSDSRSRGDVAAKSESRGDVAAKSESRGEVAAQDLSRGVDEQACEKNSAGDGENHENDVDEDALAGSVDNQGGEAEALVDAQEISGDDFTVNGQSAEAALADGLREAENPSSSGAALREHTNASDCTDLSLREIKKGVGL